MIRTSHSRSFHGLLQKKMGNRGRDEPSEALVSWTSGKRRSFNREAPHRPLGSVILCSVLSTGTFFIFQQVLEETFVPLRDFQPLVGTSRPRRNKRRAVTALVANSAFKSLLNSFECKGPLKLFLNLILYQSFNMIRFLSLSLKCLTLTV